jgi:hypothetical protein
MLRMRSAIPRGHRAQALSKTVLCGACAKAWLDWLKAT